MPSKNIKSINFTLTLFDANNKNIKKTKVIIQYYNLLKKQWINLTTKSISDSNLNIVIKSTSTVKPILLFFETLATDNIPPIRIINTKVLFETKKIEVLAIENNAQIDKEKELLHIDFGRRWLVSNEFLQNQKLNKKFILITTGSNSISENEKIKLIDQLKEALENKDDVLSKLSKNLEAQAKNISNLSKDLEAKSNDIQALQNTLEAKEESFETINVENAKLIQDIQNITKESNEKDSKIKTLTDQINKTDVIISGNQEKINSLKSENSKAKKIEENYVKLIDEEKKLNKELNVSIETERGTIKELNDQLINITTEKAKADLEIKNLKDEKIRLENDKIVLQKELEELGKEIDFDIKPIPVKTLFTNIVKEVDLAKLSNINSSYKLANVSLKMKTYVNSHEGGISVLPLSKENSAEVNGNTISELQVEVQENNETESTMITTPNLSGHTETAVRKILSSLGLRLNEVYQKNPNVPNGESFKQSPVEGKEIKINDLVTVIFSKNG